LKKRTLAEFHVAIVGEVCMAVKKLVSLTGGSRLQENTYPILWDTGASGTLTFDKEDFIDEIEWFKEPQWAMGIASGLSLLCKGKVRWNIDMYNGDMLTIEIDAFYCPKATRRLLCPQQLVQHLKENGCQDMVKVKVQETHLVFRRGKRTLYVDYDPQNNLPICYGLPSVHSSDELNAVEVNSLVTSSRSQNLSNAQKELLQNTSNLVICQCKGSKQCYEPEP
jgi:hypothetical protein